MRRVYTPPASVGGWHWTILGALSITLAVFLVLPLSQMISSGVMGSEETIMVGPVDEPPPPPPEMAEEKPPEEEQQEDQPELEEVQDIPRSLNFELGDVGGAGGYIGGGPNGFAGAEDLIESLAFDVSELDSQPVLMSSTPPQYPAKMRKARLEGAVTILFVLNEEGQVEEPRVESSSRPEFEQPAIDAIKRWKFKPGTKDGEPVKTYMRQPIQFRMPT